MENKTAVAAVDPSTALSVKVAISCGQVFGELWRVLGKLATGAFGELFIGVHVETEEKVAIKIEWLSTGKPLQLEQEYRLYQFLQQKKTTGIPRVYYFESNENYNVMIMQLLGNSLSTLHGHCQKKFSLKTVLMLAIQLLDRIEQLHSYGYLHRDIKPDNFLIGFTEQQHHIVYMIDLGFSKSYVQPETKSHIRYREGHGLIGTPRYASLNAHLGVESSRRDDLEALGYMLIYLLLGQLPWQGIQANTKAEKHLKICQVKNETTILELCRYCPEAFAKYLHHCKNLRFSEKPNYQYLRSLFREAMQTKKLLCDWKFDWT